jgi:hypothetical protein
MKEKVLVALYSFEIIAVIKYPEITIKTSTPKNPPGKIRNVPSIISA